MKPRKSIELDALTDSDEEKKKITMIQTVPQRMIKRAVSQNKARQVKLIKQYHRIRDRVNNFNTTVLDDYIHAQLS